MRGLGTMRPRGPRVTLIRLPASKYSISATVSVAIAKYEPLTRSDANPTRAPNTAAGMGAINNATQKIQPCVGRKQGRAVSPRDQKTRHGQKTRTPCIPPSDSRSSPARPAQPRKRLFQSSTGNLQESREWQNTRQGLHITSGLSRARPPKQPIGPNKKCQQQDSVDKCGTQLLWHHHRGVGLQQPQHHATNDGSDSATHAAHNNNHECIDDDVVTNGGGKKCDGNHERTRQPRRAPLHQ